MTVNLDHIVFLVSDLEAAAAQFAAAGFTILTRADNAQKGGASYRFVCFEDGSYILLTGFTPEGAAVHRLGGILAETDGPGDWSFTVASVDAARARGEAAGLTLGATHDVANTVQGAPWALRLLLAGIGTGGDNALPFVLEDVEGRDVRIPAARPHANGATGIAGLDIAAADPLASAAAVATLAGLPDPKATELDLGQGQILRFVPLDPAGLGTARTGGCTGIRLAGVTGDLTALDTPAYRIRAEIPA